MARAQVGRVSPRPLDHRQTIAPSGPMLLPLAKVLGLTGCSYVRDPAVNTERRALPRGRQTATFFDAHGLPPGSRTV